MAGLQDISPMVASSMGDQRRARAHARRRGRRLDAGVAAADDDHIEHRAHAISIPEHRIGVHATSLGMLAVPEPVVRRLQGPAHQQSRAQIHSMR